MILADALLAAAVVAAVVLTAAFTWLAVRYADAARYERSKARHVYRPVADTAPMPALPAARRYA